MVIFSVFLALLATAVPSSRAASVVCRLPTISHDDCDLNVPLIFGTTWELRHCTHASATSCSGRVSGNILSGACTEPAGATCHGLKSPRGLKCTTGDGSHAVEVVNCYTGGQC